MVRILIILCFSFTLSQNFLYDSDDWYLVKDPGSIYSITEGPFQVYFGTENGIFSYDKLDDIIEYDVQLNRGLNHNEQILSIHYDSYSDQIWILTNKGIFYKNPIFDSFNETTLDYRNDEFYNMGELGSIDRYIVLEYGAEYIFIDSFSGSQVDSISDFNVDHVIWSSSFYSYNSNDIDLSAYYSDDWLIGFRTITDTYGNDESVNVYFEDAQSNLWFGTDKGKVIKGYKYTNKVEIYNIGPFSERVTSLSRDDNGNWFLASGRFRAHRTSTQNFQYNKQANSFASIWNEYDNMWFYLNEDDFSELNNPDVNYVFNADDTFLCLGLMTGLLVISMQDYNNYYFIDESEGLSDSAIFKIEYYDDKIFAMTSEGISVYSLISNVVIEENILSRIQIEDSEILDMVIFENNLYFSTKAGLFLYDIDQELFNKISDNIFYEIEYSDKKIYGLNQHIWIIDLLNYDESVFYYGSGRNIAITDKYIWINLQDRAKLIDLESKQEWIYNHNDGFVDTEIFDIIDDGDWVCFLTDNGLMFYNWSSYHY